MKIVHVCLMGPFTDHRTYQENMLSKYHSRLGHQVTVICSKWVQTKGALDLALDSRDSYLDENGVKIVRLPMRGKEDFRKKWKRYVGLYEALEEEAPDFLFIHGAASAENRVLARYLKQHPTVRACADNHADYSNSATNLVSKYLLHGILWRREAKRLLPVVERFYGVLPARVDFLTERYGLPSEKCGLLVMGGDDELIEQAATADSRKAFRTQYGIRDTDFLVITGGKIDAWKTQTLLLMEAAQAIQDERLKLIVFGPADPALLPRVKALSDGKKVQYIGWINAEDTYRCFAAAELVVFPGRHSVFWEQTAAQGIPMLCKDWPGTHHVDAGGNVRFLKEDSAAEIEDQIRALLEDQNAYQSMKTAAVQQGMRQFSYRRIAEQSISNAETIGG